MQKFIEEIYDQKIGLNPDDLAQALEDYGLNLEQYVLFRLVYSYDDLLLSRALELFDGDLNFVDIFGNGLLIYALQSLHISFPIVSLLLTKGADTNICDEDGKTPLMKAVCNRSFGNQSDFITALVEAGADINAKDLDGTNALMHAVRAENIDNVSKLLEYEPRIFMVFDNSDQMVFSYTKNEAILKMLEESSSNEVILM